MHNGILILAMGHRNYYRMAVNLAASIRANDPAMPVCLVTDSAVDAVHAHLFTIKRPPKRMCPNGDFIRTKLHMYDLSPFQRTIFLDADQIIITGRTLMPVFTLLQEVDVSFSNTGIATESYWADISEVKKLYGDSPFWNFHSEFVYFNKSPSAAEFFKAALAVYMENKITSARAFAKANMADELAFQVAAMLTGVYPHAENWLPNYWYNRSPGERKYPYQLKNITYSMGGRNNPEWAKNNYNNLAKHYFATLGLSNPFQAVDKRKYLPERMTT